MSLKIFQSILPFIIIKRFFKSPLVKDAFKTKIWVRRKIASKIWTSNIS